MAKRNDLGRMARTPQGRRASRVTPVTTPLLPTKEDCDMNHRFSVNEDGHIIDVLNPANDGSGHYFDDDPKDEMHLRECVLRRRMSHLVDDLIINNDPMEDLPTGDKYQPYCEVRHPIWRAIFKAIRASHLNTLDVGLSLQHRFSGELKREKLGWQDCASLSLFVDDVERVLRDLYGEADNEAIDRARRAIFTIVEEFTKFLRNDIWQEHYDAVNVDYMCGIGVPEGCGLSESDYRRGQCASHDLELRAGAVRANPEAFSKYTVEFVNELFLNWRWLSHPMDKARPSEEARPSKEVQPLEEVPF
jgi:hypothetical protein